MVDVLGSPGPMDARIAELSRLDTQVAGNPFAVNSGSNAGAVTTVTHTTPLDADLALIFYAIRGGGSVLTSVWDPPNADPTTNNTFIRAKTTPAAASSRVELWIQRINPTQRGLNNDITTTYTGTIGHVVKAIVSISGVDPSNLFADTQDASTDSAGSLSVNVYGINSSMMITMCGMRTQTSQTCTKDASQTEHVNLLTAANGLRGVLTSEYTVGDRDAQSFTFGDGTRPATIMSVVLNPMRGRAARVGFQPNLRAAPFQPGAKPFIGFRGW